MVGDTYTNFGNVVAAAFLECKPGAGYEFIIHNIYHPVDVEIKMVDGSGNECAFMVEAGKSVITNMYFHLTETQYLRIYNTSGGGAWIAADGIVSKEP